MDTPATTRSFKLLKGETYVYLFTDFFTYSTACDSTTADSSFFFQAWNVSTGKEFNNVDDDFVIDYERKTFYMKVPVNSYSQIWYVYLKG